MELYLDPYHAKADWNLVLGRYEVMILPHNLPHKPADPLGHTMTAYVADLARATACLPPPWSQPPVLCHRTIARNSWLRTSSPSRETRTTWCSTPGHVRA